MTEAEAFERVRRAVDRQLSGAAAPVFGGPGCLTISVGKNDAGEIGAIVDCAGGLFWVAADGEAIKLLHWWGDRAPTIFAMPAGIA